MKKVLFCAKFNCQNDEYDQRQTISISDDNFYECEYHNLDEAKAAIKQIAAETAVRWVEYFKHEIEITDTKLESVVFV